MLGKDYWRSTKSALRDGDRCLLQELVTGLEEPNESMSTGETRSNGPLISFAGVAKDFVSGKESLRVVQNIDLDIYAGEIVTLVGPSGCGKSTLLNLAAGLFSPTLGCVRYKGDEITGLNRKTGYMTQSDHLLPWRTVFGNIAKGGGCALDCGLSFAPGGYRALCLGDRVSCFGDYRLGMASCGLGPPHGMARPYQEWNAARRAVESRCGCRLGSGTGQASGLLLHISRGAYFWRNW